MEGIMIISDYSNGMTINELMEKYKITRKEVNTVLDNFIIECSQQGKTRQQIADILNISKTSVIDRLKTHNLVNTTTQGGKRITDIEKI